MHEELVAQSKLGTDSDAIVPLDSIPSLTGKHRVRTLLGKVSATLSVFSPVSSKIKEDIEKHRIHRLSSYMNTLLQLSFDHLKRPNYILLAFLGMLSNKIGAGAATTSTATITATGASDMAPPVTPRSSKISEDIRTSNEYEHGLSYTTPTKRNSHGVSLDAGGSTYSASKAAVTAAGSRASVHISMLANVAKPGDLVLFRSLSVAAQLQRMFSIKHCCC